MVEWSITTDCKSVGLRPTKVRILPGAQWVNKMELKISKLWFALPFLMLAALIVLGATNVVKLEEILHLLVHFKLSWIATIIVFQIGTYVAVSVSWHVVATHGGHNISIKNLIHLAVEKFSIDQLIPAAGLAGNLAVVKVMKKMGLPQPLAIEALVIETVTYFAAYGILALGLMLLLEIHYNPYFLVPVFFIVFSLVMLFNIAVVWRLVNNRHKPLPNWLEKRKFTHTIRGYLEGVSEERMSSKKIIISVLLLQISVFILDSLTLWAIFHALGVKVSILTALVGFVMAAIGGLISFIPAGAGFFEASGIGTMALLGVPLEAALTATLVLRGFTLWLPLIPGTIFAYRDHVLEK